MKTLYDRIMMSLFGSKYNPRIPRTYEAVINNDLAGMPLNEQYLGDTICSLVNLLKKKQVDPSHVKIFEMYGDNREKQLPLEFYMNEQGKWYPRTELCKMTKRYGEEEKFDTCSFMDRNGSPCGPYFDLVMK